MKAIVCALLFAMIGSGCVGSRYPKVDIAKAESDAYRDIANGDLRFYFGGGFVPMPIGIPKVFWYLISQVEQVDGGSGCVLDDSADRLRLHEYAIVYNRVVAIHLLKQEGLSAEDFDAEVEKEKK